MERMDKGKGARGINKKQRVLGELSGYESPFVELIRIPWRERRSGQGLDADFGVGNRLQHRLGRDQLPLLRFVPVQPLEKRMLLHLFRVLWASTKTTLRVPIEELDNEIGGDLGHAHGDMQGALADVVKELFSRGWERELTCRG